MGVAAAGVMPGPPAAGWVCSPRRGVDAGAEDRVCVLLEPELPEAARRGWRCHYLHDPERRMCKRDPAAPAVGAECREDAACVEGTRCREGRCLPDAPRPGCWLATDCPAGERCLFGSCRA
jgi:hypothetical protein